MADTEWFDSDRAGNDVGIAEAVADLAREGSTAKKLGDPFFGPLGPAAEIVGGGIDIAKAYDSYQDGDYADALADGLGGAGGIVKGGLGLAGVDAPAWLDVGLGSVEVAKGITDIATDEGYGGQTLDGIHDILTGGSDIVGGIAGENTQIGAAAKGFGAGMKIGDAIAPFVFHDAATSGTHTQAIPENGFRAGTGNASVDGILHGVQDLGNGDYRGAAGNLLEGAGGALQLAVDPVGAIASQTLSGGIASLWE